MSKTLRRRYSNTMVAVVAAVVILGGLLAPTVLELLRFA